MKYISLTFLLILVSCSSKQNIFYIKDSDKNPIFNKIENLESLNLIEPGDILKIDVLTSVPEAAIAYNKNVQDNQNSYNLELHKLNGYVVDKFSMINFPVLGEIKSGGFSERELEMIITNLLIDNNHLINPVVKVRRVNCKFTVIGEVNNPGTYTYLDKSLNIFQALGYAGDLTIYGKRTDVRLIRKFNSEYQVHKVSLTDSRILDSDVFNIKNNDIIIINPRFSKVKSAGFIGSPSSVASIASLLLSITLLITNN